jgi:hypothetical protein
MIKKYARLIIYKGEEDWVNKTLEKSLNFGINHMGKHNTITVLDAKMLTGDPPDAEENNFHARDTFEVFDLE